MSGRIEPGILKTFIFSTEKVVECEVDKKTQQGAKRSLEMLQKSSVEKVEFPPPKSQRPVLLSSLSDVENFLLSSSESDEEIPGINSFLNLVPQQLMSPETAMLAKVVNIGTMTCNELFVFYKVPQELQEEVIIVRSRKKKFSRMPLCVLIKKLCATREYNAEELGILLKRSSVTIQAMIKKLKDSGELILCSGDWERTTYKATASTEPLIFPKNVRAMKSIPEEILFNELSSVGVRKEPSTLKPSEVTFEKPLGNQSFEDLYTHDDPYQYFLHAFKDKK